MYLSGINTLTYTYLIIKMVKSNTRKCELVCHAGYRWERKAEREISSQSDVKGDATASRKPHFRCNYRPHYVKSATTTLLLEHNSQILSSDGVCNYSRFDVHRILTVSSSHTWCFLLLQQWDAAVLRRVPTQSSSGDSLQGHATTPRRSISQRGPGYDGDSLKTALDPTNKRNK